MQAFQQHPSSPCAVSLADIQPAHKFIEQCEAEGTATGGQLRWWLRFRYQNGLVSSGAVIEKRAHPGVKRPAIFFNVPRFIEWLSSSQEGGAA